MKKESAIRNIEVIQEILESLPEWMVPKKMYDKGEKHVTQIKLWNGSSIKVFFPSTIHKPNTLARALSAPILYIDESAFIHNMREIFEGAAPILFKAQEQAKKNNYPYFTFITSTPNGKTGDGEWFYERWENGLDSEDVFDYYEERKGHYWKPEYIIQEKNKKTIDKDKLEKRSIENTTNGYIKVRYHWSEDPTKDERWYQLMCSELSDPRIINQELNLVFVGGQRSILTDEVIQKFSPKETINQIMTPNFANFRIYDQIDPLDWYIIGVDTASERSEKSAFNALQIMKFSNLSQIAEVHHRHGSFLQWADDVEFIFTWLHNQVGDRIILAVEVNTIGKSTFEHLVYDTHRKFNFMRYMYCEDYDNQKFGIYTSGITKATMVKSLLDIIKENPELVKSKFLIDQLSSIERSNSSKTITSPGFTDLFMASCFCAYVKEKKWLDIAPLINKSQSKINQNTFDNIKGVISASNDKKYFTPEIEMMGGMPVIKIDRDEQKKNIINPNDLTYKELEMFKIINSSYKDERPSSDDPDEKYYNLYKEENEIDFFGNFTNKDNK